MADEWWDELWEALGEQERAIIRQMARWEQHTFLTRMGEAVADVTQRVQELNGDPGTVTVKLKVAPSGPNNPLMALTAKITQVMPGHKPLGAHGYFVGGQWFERDPNAPVLGEGRATVRDVERRLADRPTQNRRVREDNDDGR